MFTRWNADADVLARLGIRAGISHGSTAAVLDGSAVQAAYQVCLPAGPRQHRPVGFVGAGGARVHPDRPRGGAKRATGRTSPRARRESPSSTPHDSTVSGPAGA